MKRLVTVSALILSFLLALSSGARAESAPQVTRTIVTYFQAVQNKDLPGVAKTLVITDPKTTNVYQATFKAISQRLVNYKMEKILRYNTRALVLVRSRWQITSVATGEGFTATNEHAFLLEKKGSTWKIARILPAQNLDLLLKNYFFKKERPRGWKMAGTQESESGQSPARRPIPKASSSKVYNTADNGENFLELEYDTDRPGMDYRGFDLPSNDPMLCQKACNHDPKCKAWTFVKPNTIQGPRPRCWLKHAVPPAHYAPCCVSGVKDIPEKEKREASLLKGSPFTESWFGPWRVVRIIRDPDGGIGKIYNSNQRFGWKKPVKRIGDAMPPPGARGAALYIHPISPQEPTVLHGTYRVSSPRQALLFRVAGNANGDWLMEVKVNGVKQLEKRIDGRKWYDLKVPLGKYAGQKVSVDLYVKANGWFYEYAFIDEIRLVNN